MKVVLVKSPKFLSGILRMIFGIKKQNIWIPVTSQPQLYKTIQLRLWCYVFGMAAARLKRKSVFLFHRLECCPYRLRAWAFLIYGVMLYPAARRLSRCLQVLLKHRIIPLRIFFWKKPTCYLVNLLSLNVFTINRISAIRMKTEMIPRLLMIDYSHFQR